jgi:hypothetical protein
MAIMADLYFPNMFIWGIPPSRPVPYLPAQDFDPPKKG